MDLETCDRDGGQSLLFEASAAAPGQPPAALPAGVVLVERMASCLRAYLRGRGLGHWRIFFAMGAELGDVDAARPHLAGRPTWEPLPGLSHDGEQASAIFDTRPDATSDADPFGADEREPRPILGIDVRRPGCLWLREHEVVVARWHTMDLNNYCWMPLYLYAAPSSREYDAVRRRVRECTRRRSQPIWQIADGTPWGGPPIPRDLRLTFDALTLADDVRTRLVGEAANFFAEPVAALYRRLGVPYRRGVLLYGPPGNGKTSLVRAVGAANPDVPALLLRPGDDFGDRSLQNVLDAWRDQAPAILVIEDLDWLFNQGNLNVSTFLNTLDGIGRRDGGLLLLATTNHPERLDPAINSRPGRFDMTVEVQNPDRALRARYLDGRPGFPPLEPGEFDRLIDEADGYSFAHLRELENLSGLIALRAGRPDRTASDLFAAAEMVGTGIAQAATGFQPTASANFGLQAARRRGGGAKR